MSQHLTIVERHFTFQNRLHAFSIVNHNYRELNEFFDAAFPLFEQHVSPVINSNYLVKIATCFVVKYKKNEVAENENENTTDTQIIYYNTWNEIVDFETNLRTFYDDIISSLNERIDEVQMGGIEYVLSEILEYNIQISSFDPSVPYLTVEERNFAFQNRLQTFSIVNHNYTDLDDFFNAAFPLFEQNVMPLINLNYLVKISACFVGKYEKNIETEDGDSAEPQTLYHNSRVEIVDFETNLRTFYNDIIKFVNERIDDIQMRGSGFALSEILELNIQISSFDPLEGSSFMALPKPLFDKHAIINVRNLDDQCFKYAVLSALFPPSGRNCHPERVSHYKVHEKKLNFNGLKYPVDLQQISTFERNNKSVSIHVYMFDETSVTVKPIRLSKEIRENHIHLLLLTSESESCDETAKPRSHYCWIKKLHTLLGAQVSTTEHKRYFCDRCLNNFATEDSLKKHSVYCQSQNECEIKMPTLEKNFVEFKNSKNELKVPFVVYADIESMLVPSDKKFSSTDTTSAYQQHVPYSIGFYFRNEYAPHHSYYKFKRGRDCLQWFTHELYEIYNYVDMRLNYPRKLKMSDEDEVLFIWSQECHIH